MAVKTNLSVFYHIPKTGGIWVKSAMIRAGLNYDRCRNIKGMSHKFALKREHAIPDVVCDEYKKDLFSFCFIRHPVEWYKSFWCYRLKTGHLSTKFPLDSLWDDSFEKFVSNVLREYPGGFVTELYQCYVGENADKLDFIGKQETLANDLVKALTLAGEDFNEEDLRHTRLRNVSAGHPEYKNMCVLTKETQSMVLDSEKWVINQFYG